MSYEIWTVQLEQQSPDDEHPASSHAKYSIVEEVVNVVIFSSWIVFLDQRLTEVIFSRKWIHTITGTTLRGQGGVNLGLGYSGSKG